MKIKNLFLLPALIAGLGLIPAGRMTAQTLTNLHSFSGGSDGAAPLAGLILSGNTLYGTAVIGGSSGNGTVFKINTDNIDFTTLHSFTARSGDFPYTTNSDGGNPRASLILSGNTLYGTAFYGGSSGNGTVFAVNTNGTDFTNLHSFTATSIANPYTNIDGANPYARLILSDNTLYGTAHNGGSSGKGTVFALNTDGTGFTNLHNFTGINDGASPYAGLVLSGDTLYGTAAFGGNSSDGTVFAIKTNGTGFTNLHSFAYGSDGSGLLGGVILAGNTLYGTSYQGGSSGNGTVFKINTNGTGFTNLHNFTGFIDGSNPYAGLILSGNTLFGTTEYGGLGKLFAVNIDGSDFTTLYSFGNSDGYNPKAGLVLSGNILYGTTSQGGPNGGNGTVFSLSLPLPQLNIASVGNQSVLYWPISATNYVLQSTTNLASSNWVTASNAVPVIAVTVTNTSPARFFRLQQQQ